MNSWARRMCLAALCTLIATMMAACGGNNASTGGNTSTGGSTGGATSAPDAATGGDTGASATAAPAGGEATVAPASGEATAAPSSGGAATASAGAAMTLPAECSTVDLQYWNPFTGPDQPFMQTIVDNFNAANPNVQVTMTAQAEYNTQLSTAAASGTLPDVAIINEDQVATQAFNGVIRPMDGVLPQMGLTANDFPAVAWGAGTVAGKQYAIPLSFVAMTMYYNEDLLKAAGLSAPPTNAEEFDKAAAAMTSGGNKGYLITNGFPVQQIFQQLLHQYGGTEFSADGTKATWNSEAGVKALQWMKDAQTKYGEPNLEVDADLNAFKAGTAGMIWNGSWQIPNVTGEAVGFAGKLAPVPQIGDQPAVWAGGPLLALPAKPQPDTCKDAGAAMFIRYVIDNSPIWAKGGNVPAYNAARQNPEFTALPQAALAKSVETPIFPPSIPGIGDAFAPLGEAVGAVISGTETDIKKALDDSAARADQILAQNKQSFGDAPKGQ